ncbi:aldose 1-epimerase [Kiloniella antarctica]|uniref:Aldose 1-epimerase n=1 Tax=Kiloniella antarctica TaxID=1550907 RepID=A0ABW5BQC8_9PROT
MNTSLQITNDRASLSATLKGGCITSYSIQTSESDLEILRSFGQRNKASFPLIPYSNRIKEGRFSFEGKQYQLPLNFGKHPHSIHGVGWQENWQLIEHEANHIIMELYHPGTTWPFPFKARQIIKLNGADLYNEIQLTNLASKSMPAGLGMHPYFPRHGKAFLTAEVGQVWQTNETGLPIERKNCPPNWNLSAGVNVDKLHCDNQFDPWSRTAFIHWPKKNTSLSLTSSEDLNRLVVYAPENENFFCVEPTSHITDAFNNTSLGKFPQETGMRVLAPNETWTVWMTLSPKQE